MTLWMAADQNSPPDMDMSNVGWDMNASVISHCIDPGPTRPVPAIYVRQSQMCPQLDMSDKNVQKTQDMSDKARCVRQKLQKNRKICPTDVSDKNENKMQDMSDRT